MSDSKVSVNQSGFPVFGILTVVFVLAKVFGVDPVAGWSWFWVLSPVWISLSVAILILLIAAIIAVIIAVLK